MHFSSFGCSILCVIFECSVLEFNQAVLLKVLNLGICPPSGNSSSRLSKVPASFSLWLPPDNKGLPQQHAE
jgi:hypothetical protein